MGDFYEDLDFSLESTAREVLDKYYYKKFTNTVNIVEEDDIEHQKLGVDIMLFQNDKTIIYIDEKRRSKDYGDMLLEEFSNLETGKIGWTGDPSKKTNYIIYYILESNERLMIKCIPYKALRKAWNVNYINWKKQYGTRKAYTKRNGEVLYTTTNIPVPWDVLNMAMQDVG